MCFVKLVGHLQYKYTVWSCLLCSLLLLARSVHCASIQAVGCDRGKHGIGAFSHSQISNCWLFVSEQISVFSGGLCCPIPWCPFSQLNSFFYRTFTQLLQLLVENFLHLCSHNCIAFLCLGWDCVHCVICDSLCFERLLFICFVFHCVRVLLVCLVWLGSKLPWRLEQVWSVVWLDYTRTVFYCISCMIRLYSCVILTLCSTVCYTVLVVWLDYTRVLHCVTCMIRLYSCVILAQCSTVLVVWLDYTCVFCTLCYTRTVFYCHCVICIKYTRVFYWTLRACLFTLCSPPMCVCVKSGSRLCVKCVV